MVEVKLKSLGMEGTGQEPSSVDEFDTIAKKPGMCLTRACEYIRFHVTLGEIRELFLHGQAAVAATADATAQEAIVGVEEETKIPRNTKPVLGKDGKPAMKDGEPVTEFDETEGKYFARVIATLVKDGKFSDEETAKASFQPLFDQVIKVVGFPAERAQSKSHLPTKLAAKYKLAAAKVITIGNVDAVNTNILSKINKTFTATGDTSKMFTGTFANGDGKDVAFNVSDKDAEALGWLIKGYQDWKSAQELASLGI